MPFFRLPEGVAATVAAGGGPLTVDAVEYADPATPTDTPQPTGHTERVVVFLDGATVRSAPEAQAPALIAALEAERQAALQLRQQIIGLAQSAVGVSLNALTAAQRNALIACLLWKAGGVAPDMTVRPLGQWLQ